MALKQVDEVPNWWTLKEKDDTAIFAEQMLTEFLENEDMEAAIVSGWPEKRGEDEVTAAIRNIGALRKEINIRGVADFIKAARRGANIYLYRKYE